MGASGSADSTKQGRGGSDMLKNVLTSGWRWRCAGVETVMARRVAGPSNMSYPALESPFLKLESTILHALPTVSLDRRGSPQSGRGRTFAASLHFLPQFPRLPPPSPAATVQDYLEPIVSQRQIASGMPNTIKRTSSFVNALKPLHWWGCFLAVGGCSPPTWPQGPSTFESFRMPV